MIKIALLDDEVTQTQLMELSLVGGENGWHDEVSCDVFTSGMALLEKIKKQHYHCVILDRQVPDMSGDVILQYLRQYSKKYVPVVMLSNLRRQNDVLQGLEAGADEYMTKPFSPQELLFRVQRLIRRFEAPAPVSTNMPDQCNNFSVGKFTFNAFELTVTLTDQVVKLTEREFALATLLFKNIGVNVSRTDLIREGWGKETLPKRTLEMHIHHLRQKLELTEEKGYLLRSIYGFGYRLTSKTDTTLNLPTAH